MSVTKKLDDYAYCYVVNLHLQPGQLFPTFSPIARTFPARTFPRLAGANYAGMAAYYTDEAVNMEDIGSLEFHTQKVLAGGPGIVKPEADDKQIMEKLREGGAFSESSMRRAESASMELQGVLAAEGHFKFTLV